MRKDLLTDEERRLEDRAFEMLQKAKELGSMKDAARHMGIVDFDELLDLWKMADEREQDLRAEQVSKLCEVSRVLKEHGSDLTEEAVQRLIQFIGC